MKLFWFIPTHGDGRYLGTSHGGRPLDFSYLKQIACAVDNLGFYGALLPTGRLCEDAWIYRRLFDSRDSPDAVPRPDSTRVNLAEPCSTDDRHL